MALSALAALLFGAGGEALAADAERVTRSFCKSGDLQGGFFMDPQGNPVTSVQANSSADILSDGRIRLTEAKVNKNGSAYYTTLDPAGNNIALDFSYPAAGQAPTLHTYFSFNIPAGNPGDGLTFLMIDEAYSPGSTGSTGNGLGYTGIGAKVLVFEFDNFKNLIDPPDAFDSHIGFMLNGSNTDHVAYATADQNNVPLSFFDAAQVWHVWIDYMPQPNQPTAAFRLYLSKNNEKPSTPITLTKNPLSLSPYDPENFDLAKYFEKLNMSAEAISQVYMGFTAATGNGSSNEHDILEWEFSNNGEIPCRCQANDAVCANTDPTRPACSMGDSSVLDQGICVECTTNNHCKFDQTRPTCNNNTEKCVQCTAGDQTYCEGMQKVCDPTKEECVDCLVDDDCVKKGMVCCNQATFTCGNNEDCGGAGGAGGAGGNNTGGGGNNTGGGGNNTGGGGNNTGGGGDTGGGGNTGSGGNPFDGDIIEGGGCACIAAGAPSSTTKGMLAGLLGGLGAAAAVARRRRRAS
jgi:MYXO-CTERM domain-containing protein